MIRRLFWMAIGASGALWSRRKAVKAIERYVPKRVADRLASEARVRARAATKAVATVRREAAGAMRDEERALRDRFDGARG